MKLKLTEDTTLIEALALLAPKSSKTSLRAWIREGRVSIDGCTAKNSGEHLRRGQTVSVGARLKFMDGGIKIIYEDKDIIVIDKPQGLLSVSTAFEKTETAHSYLKKRCLPAKVYVVHRLDQDTSGVMVYALTSSALEKLKKIFEAHDLERKYKAIVQGRMENPQGIWQSRLYEDDNYVVHSTQDQNKGRGAITHYQVEAAAKSYSLLDLTLETGRKNQIRVHCQEAGHPIVGDKKYGAGSNPLKRLGLHAYLLAFRHPITDKWMRFESPVPDEFFQLLRPAHQKKTTKRGPRDA